MYSVFADFVCRMDAFVQHLAGKSGGLEVGALVSHCRVGDCGGYESGPGKRHSCSSIWDVHLAAAPFGTDREKQISSTRAAKA